MNQPVLFPGEQIRDIPGYEGLYAATTHGRIWSYPKKRKSRKGFTALYKGLILSENLNRDGHARATLVKEGSKKTIFQHTLILLTFGRPPAFGEVVNHLDGNKINNFLENLEWCTPLQNKHHAMRAGLSNKRSSKYVGVSLNRGSNKTKTWQVTVIEECRKKYLGRFETEEEAARAYDIYVVSRGLDKILNFPKLVSDV